MRTFCRSILVGFLVMGFVASCGSENDTGSAAVQLQWMSSQQALGLRGDLSGIVNTIAVTISANGKVLLQKEFSYEALQGTIKGIPAGTGRTFLVEALSSSVVVYSGTADNITIEAGKTVTVGPVVMSPAYSQDTYPPAAITDLRATSTVGINDLDLYWTATGNDAHVGKAASYDLRISNNAIDDSNFNAATAVTGLPAPADAGSAEHVTVTGLTWGATYHFAIKAIDGSNNVSGISNDASAQAGANTPTHILTYDGNTPDSGSVPAGPTSYYEGQTVTVLGNTGNPVLVKAGYTFVGWNTAANGSGTPYAASAQFAMGTADLTLYAQWTNLPTHTVTYNGNTADSGNPPAGPASYYVGQTVTVFGNTGPYVKAGYTFGGWNTAANGSGNAYAASDTFTMGTAAVTLYAQWMANPSHTVSYNGNTADSGNPPAGPTSYLEGLTVTVLDNTGTPPYVKAGYTFTGWNTAANGSGTGYVASQTFIMSTANVTLYAQWTANPSHTVSYNGNTADSGNPPAGPTSYLEGQTVTVLGNTGNYVKAGFTFVGWNTAANGSGTGYVASQTFIMATANVTLYAQWTALPTHTLTYNGNTADSGNPPTGPTSYYEGQTVTVLGNTGPYVKAGFNFAGWNTAANGSGTSYVASDTFSMGTANVTLYAQWTAAPTHTLTYNGNTADSGSAPAVPTSYYEGQTVTVLGNTGPYVKAGYTFANWNTAANGSGTSYVASNTFSMGTANVTLYAQWTAIPTHTLTYNGNTADSGSAPAGPTSYYEGQTVTVLGNTGPFVKAGYTFASWNTAANGSGTTYVASNTFSMGTANVTLYAQWTAIPTHTVTYNGNTADSGSAPAVPTSYYEGQTVTVLGNTGPYVKAGYTFASWNTAANGSGTSYVASNTFSMGTANVTLYAQWTAIPTHTVTYNGNGQDSGSAPAVPTSYYEGQTVTVLGNTGPFVKAGYTFADWNTAANGSGTSYVASNTFAMGTANVTLYAQWTAIPTHTVTYNGNGQDSGSAPAGPTSYYEGQTVTVLDNTGSYVKAGFTFAGWNTAANGSGTGYVASNTFAMGTADVTLYAQWTAIPTHTVTYDGNTADSGNPPAGPTSYYEGQTVTVLDNTGPFVKAGYTFGGWNTAADGSGTGYVASNTFAMGTADVTLYAKWN